LPDPNSLPADLNGWLEYLERLHPKTIELGLERIGLVRDRLVLKHDFPIITVAGTNGKGSTCAMLERIYIESGYRVACYTSPHLLRYNERVRVNGDEASDAQICRAFAAVEQARQSTPITYFEFGTLAAMWHFIDSNVDIAILEVGLGGRLDAVNIFDSACAVVTSIDLDHMDYLGAGRENIGREKACIYREATPALCGDPDPPSSVRNLAAHVGAEYRQLGEDFSFELGLDEWDFVTRGKRINNLPLPALSGNFQFYNASCAIQSIQELQQRIPVPDDAIRAGLRHVALQGRFQVCAGDPTVILDVAHNPHAARGLAENLRTVPQTGRVLAVFAMLADKDIAGVVRVLADEVDSWFVASIRHARGAEASVLAGILHELTPEVPVKCFVDVTSAFRQACLSAHENDKIIVFGSFYTVADVLRGLPSRPGN
jgi:dihydrofolate synthase / folylpolyglutamate synthase